MLITITLGSRISVQGELVAQLPTGKLVVRAGTRIYRGRPVKPAAELSILGGAAA